MRRWWLGLSPMAQSMATLTFFVVCFIIVFSS